jgi:hypothetical protein
LISYCVADLSCGPAHSQSQTSMRFHDHVESNLSSLQTNSGTEPGTTLADKNGVIELGNVPPDVHIHYDTIPH